MKKIILFNKETGTFFASFESEGFDVEGIDPNFFVYKEVELNDGEFWYGNYETGKVYDNKETVVVPQSNLRDEAIKKIFSKYHTIRQTQIIIDQLKAFIPAENQTEDFVNMYTYIDEIRAEYHLKKEAFSSNPEAYIWVSDEETENNISSRLTGLL